jgi:Skp family chaperone for outer membrane proteins
MRFPGFRGPLLVVATLVAAGAAAAAGYALTAPKHYRATAQLLVSPVGESDTAYTGIDVLRDSGGKRTAAESAAALVRGPLIADAVRALLGAHRSRDELLAAVDADVVDASDVVAVTADDTSANGAARLANAFVDTLINQRTATFQSEVSAAVRRYTQLLSQMSRAERAGPGGAELERRLAVLRTVQGQPDPSLSHAGQATAPTDASSAGVGELTGLGALIGLGAGALAALALFLVRRREPLPAAAYDRLVADDAGLEELVTKLDDRLAAREAALAARERDLQAAIAELRAAQAQVLDEEHAARLAELERRERDLDERVAAVTKRELEVARLTAEAAVREREPEPEPEPAPPPVPFAPPLPPLEGAADGRYNLVALERLVEARAGDYPERAEEWSSYLFFLREYAGPDGNVPATFDWLIQDTFGELVS